MSLRRISGLARRFPSKAAADRILPWLTVAAGLVGGVIALWQYLEQGREQRVKATMEFVKDFQYKDLKKDVTFRKAFIELMDESLVSANAATEIIKTQQPAPPKPEIRKTIQAAITKKAMLRADEAMALQHFFSLVAICARDGTCDADTASRYFGDPMLGFVNSYCGFFEMRREQWNSGEALDTEIVAFLRKYHLRYKPLPEGREDWFFCEAHRRTARKYFPH